jgi:adenine phosphoribosyltransferase
VLLVDDVIATGGTLAAACRLINNLGGELVEIVTVVELTFLPGREQIKGLPFHSMIQF